MPRPDFRLTCCLCSKTIPRASDVHALDEEWQRRNPSMVGILACTTCIDTQHWDCWGADGDYVEGHLPVTHQIDGRYYDCWDHLQGFGTHVAMAQAYPESSVLQGAEEYLRYTAQRSDIDPQVRQRLLAALR